MSSSHEPGPVAIYVGNHRALIRTVHGHRMLIPTDDRSSSYTLLVDGSWRENVSDVMKRYVRAGMTVLDAGASFGYYTLLMCELVGVSGGVIAIEPSLDAFELLAYNVEHNHGFEMRSKLVQKAVGSLAGSARLYRPTTSLGAYWGSATLDEARAREHSHTTYVTSEEVEVVTLDELMDLQPIDFAKVDVEGSEWPMWEGGAKTLGAASYIVMEYVLQCPDSDVNRLEDICKEFGFASFLIDDQSEVIPMTPKSLSELALTRWGVDVLLKKRGLPE